MLLWIVVATSVAEENLTIEYWEELPDHWSTQLAQNFSLYPDMWVGIGRKETSSGDISGDIGWVGLWSTIEQPYMHWKIESLHSAHPQSVVLAEEQIVVCGVEFSAGYSQAWLWVNTLDGVQTLDTTIWNVGNSECTSLAQTEDGWLLGIVHRSEEGNSSSIVRLNSNFEYLHSIALSDQIEITGLVYHHEQIAVSGYTATTDTTFGWIGVLNSVGQEIWHSTLGAGKWNKIKMMQMDQDANLIGCGYSAHDPSNWDIWLLRWDWQGNIQLDTVWGGEKKDGCKNITQISPNTYQFIGDTESFSDVSAGWDVLLGVVDTDGVVMDWQSFGGEGDDYGYDLLYDGSSLLFWGTLFAQNHVYPWYAVSSVHTENTDIESVHTEKNTVCAVYSTQDVSWWLFVGALCVSTRKRNIVL